MPSLTAIYRYLITIAVFLLFDSLWLGVIAPDLYEVWIGHLLGPVNWLAAVLFYLVYIAGIVYFAVSPALKAENRPVLLAARHGAVFGFVAYATYDLTNWATLDGWPVVMVVVDLCWGTVLTGAVAAASCFVSQKLKVG